jgi:hypothetical protein
MSQNSRPATNKIAIQLLLSQLGLWLIIDWLNVNRPSQFRLEHLIQPFFEVVNNNQNKSLLNRPAFSRPFH